MKFRMQVSDGSTSWWEPYDKPEVDDPEEWARHTLARFNTTLRLGEEPRTLLSVEVLGESEVHHWQKVNLVTLSDPHGGFYDIYHCPRCGITGKRVGLGDVQRDYKYRARKFEKCHARD